MLKNAFYSYMSSLRPRNIKKLKNNNGGFWLIYWGFIYPLMISGTNPDFARIMCFTVVKMTPFFIMGWSNLSSKFLMPKAMFLCPMKEEDRQKYVNAVLVMKIGIPVLIGIGIELIWSIFFGFELIQIATIAFIHFSVGIATHICFEGKGKNDQSISFARTDKEGKIRWAWLNIVLLILGVLLLAGFEATDMTSEMSMEGVIVIGIILVIFIVLDIVIVATQYSGTIEQAGNYELTFHVLSQVPTKKKSRV